MKRPSTCPSSHNNSGSMLDTGQPRPHNLAVLCHVTISGFMAHNDGPEHPRNGAKLGRGRFFDFGKISREPSYGPQGPAEQAGPCGDKRSEDRSGAPSSGRPKVRSFPRKDVRLIVPQLLPAGDRVREGKHKLAGGSSRTPLANRLHERRT